MDDLLRYFPNNLFSLLKNIISKDERIKNELQEIRIRTKKPVILKLQNKDIVLDYIAEQSEILQILEKLCENSIYAYKKQICDGFLTIKGGHRIGITGSAVMENNKIVNMNYINSLNFRIAREVLNCSNHIIGQVLDLKNKKVLVQANIFLCKTKIFIIL